MKRFRKKVRQLVKQMFGVFPSKLPIGHEEHRAFASSILKLYDLPDFPDYRHIIATMIMHLKPTVTRASKRFFGKSVKKHMANQVSYEIIKEINAEVAAAKKEAAEVKASDEQPIQN